MARKVVRTIISNDKLPEELALNLARSGSLVLAPDEFGCLAYDAATGRLLHLNTSAAVIVELCDGTHDAAEIETLLAAIVGPSAAVSCGTWIESAIESGLIHTTAVGTVGTVGPLGDGPDAHAREDLAAVAERLRDEGCVLAAFVCQWQAAHCDPARADHWYDLGELAHIVGRRDDARDAYEHYLALSPDDEEIGLVLVSLRDEAPPARASDRCITQLYSRFASFYDENMCGELDYQAPAHLERALSAELDGRRELRILDLGCGTGLAGRRLRVHAARLVGIDLSDEMLARASATGVYDRIESAEITDWLGRASDRFDVVAACDSLIYFGDLHAVIAGAVRVLAASTPGTPGGLIAFTVERGDGDPFTLTDSGRFAHHANHIRRVALDQGLQVRRLEEVTLRYEYSEPVAGLVAVLQHGSAGRRDTLDRRVGLCATCIHAQHVPSSKGSDFLLCGLAAVDPEFPKYPPLPVVECRGYE